MGARIKNRRLGRNRHLANRGWSRFGVILTVQDRRDIHRIACKEKDAGRSTHVLFGRRQAEITWRGYPMTVIFNKRQAITIYPAVVGAFSLVAIAEELA